jgi:hypothetical protein
MFHHEHDAESSDISDLARIFQINGVRDVDQNESTRALSRTLDARFGRHVLFWISSKATDALPIYWIRGDSYSFSMIGSANQTFFNATHLSVEQMCCYRYDYDVQTFDVLPRPFLAELENSIQHAARGHAVLIVPFSSFRSLQNISLTIPAAILLGNPPQLEEMLGFKPWIENHLCKLGLPIIQWKHYLTSSNQQALSTEDLSGKIIREPNETGGRGHVLLSRERRCRPSLPAPPNSTIFSVGDYIAHQYSLNVGGCVFQDGEITIHPMSLQIIGALECSDRMFSYCGNEFGTLTRYLETSDYSIIESITQSTGRLLHQFGFIGAFGIDMIKDNNGRILISEINPRFQASSLISSYISHKTHTVTIHEDHIAAHVNAKLPGKRPSLHSLSTMGETVSQIFCYNSANVPESAPPAPSDNNQLHALDLKSEGVNMDPHALLFRVFSNGPVLRDGRHLSDYSKSFISKARRATRSSL